MTREIDLHGEMRRAADALTFPAVKALHERFGVPKAVCARLSLGMIGLAPMTIEERGSRWTPGGPNTRLVLPVHDQFGDLIDLAAVASHDPHEWALRTGEGEMLGAALFDEVESVALVNRRQTLRIFATPIDWLAGLRPEGPLDLIPGGVCPVEWGSALRCLRSLDESCTLVVDRGAKKRMRALLAYGGLPRVCEVSPPALGVAA